MRCHAFIIAVLACSASLSVLGDAFPYVDPIDPRVSMTIETAPPAVVVVDVDHEATFCPKTDRFICISSDAFTFAVPRGVHLGTRQWQHGGQDYRVVRSAPFDILGVKEDALYISASTKDAEVLYAYSLRRGLLAFKVSMKEGTRTFVAARDRGFGAQDRPVR